MRKSTIILILSLWLAPLLAQADISVRAYFDPQAIALGEGAQYCIAIEGDSTGNPEGNIPDPDNLRPQFIGPQTNMQIINGKSTISKILRFAVQPPGKGKFTIPSYEIRMNSQSYTVNAATLHVGEGVQPLIFSASLPKTQIYVGQAIPLNVRLLFLSKVGLRDISALTQKGDAFTQMTSLAAPAQTIETVDQVQYNALVWSACVTALKTGEQPLSFEMQAIVADPSQRNPFDDQSGLFPALPSMMAANFSQKRVSLQSNPLSLHVQPLPAEGKPLDFTGAIGQFTLSGPVLSQPSAQVGEPITIRLELSGHGNFERIGAPALALGKDWKTYTPKQNFKPKNPQGYEGTLTFEYIVIPVNETPREIPAVSFNYFNPDTARYETLTTAPTPIAITPSTTHTPAPTLSPAATAPAPAASAPAQPTLAPAKESAGSAGIPFYRHWIFWTAQGLLLAALGVAVWRLHALRQLQKHPEIARRRAVAKALKAALAEAALAAQKQDEARFFPAVQTSLRLSVGRLRDNPQALAWDELRQILIERAAEPAVVETCAQLWAMGDALKFGGASRLSLDETLQNLTRCHQAIDQLF